MNESVTTLEDRLYTIFEAYSGLSGGGMEGKGFAKLIRDCGLIDRLLTPAEVDLAFTRIKGIDRKAGFPEFLRGLEIIAEKKGVIPEQLAEFIATTSTGPVLRATKADKVRLHDDKSLFTGVYAQGGPSNVDMVNPTMSFGTPSVLEERKNESVKVLVMPSAPASSIEEVFFGFTNSQPEMDGKTFVKLCKDCSLMSKHALTTTDVDLIFARVKAKAARKITID